jgi:hypothetical protein
VFGSKDILDAYRGKIAEQVVVKIIPLKVKIGTQH